MELLKAKKFDFVSRAFGPDTFGVVNFEGSEGLSTCYKFEIMLVSTVPDVNIDDVLQQPAVFTILREDGDVPFHGILAEFEQHQAFDEFVFYRAVLVPKFWWLGLTFHNQVFLDLTIPEILSAVLKDGGLTSDDFDLRLKNDYPVWEYVCQYQESHFDFVSRWMEREGIYYFFEQTPKGEKVVLTDTTLAHTPMPEGKTMYYSPPSGLDEKHREEVIHSLVCRQRMLPRKVVVKDYNYRTPSLELQAEAQVHAKGRGEVFIYGEHFRTIKEGQALAKVRAQDLLCRRKVFPGESTIPFLRPGYTFDIEDHYRAEYNQKYLTTDLHHEGSQTSYLVSGIQKALSKSEGKPYYRNGFTVIPQNVQFRPERKTLPAKFYGTVNAKIDAAGSGKYAELDEQGRYKVVLPFDLSGRKNGKASTFLRMAQPYAGTDHGMHFPLHKDTEVLLTFIDGNPDRPIIAAAVPNPLTPSPLNSGNQTGAHLTTSGQNKIHFEDMDGMRRILMHSPTANSWIRMGAPNDPLPIPPTPPFPTPPTPPFPTPPTPPGGGGAFDGVRTHTDGNVWVEAKKRWGDYKTGVPIAPDVGPTDAQYLINKMYNFVDFAPTGIKPYVYSGQSDPLTGYPTNGTAQAKWQYIVQNGRVQVAKGDTFNTQEGNIYDFGGYWNYNLGNSYVEAHIDQKAALNANHDYDILNDGHAWTSWESKAKTNGTIKNELQEWANGAVWVEKKFGHSYSYHEGEQISINVGSSQTTKIWGEYPDYEEEYTDLGRRVSRTVDAGLVKEEWKYSPETDACMSYEVTQKAGNTQNSMKYEWANKSSAEFNFTASAGFKFEAALSFSLGITLAAKISIDLNSSQEIAIKVPFISIFSLNIERGGEIKIAIPGASLKMESPEPTVVIKGTPAKVELAAGTSLKAGMAELKSQATASIKSDGLLHCIL